MRISAFCTAVVAHMVIGHAPPAAAQVDQPRAQEYFKEAQALCERDGGRLWGVSICVPRPFATRWPSDRLVTRGIPIKGKRARPLHS